MCAGSEAINIVFLRNKDRSLLVDDSRGDRGGCSGRVSVVETDGVVLDKFLHVAMAETSVEVILLHLGVDLIEVPVVMIEAINRAHHACAMAAAGAVHKELAG